MSIRPSVPFSTKINVSHPAGVALVSLALLTPCLLAAAPAPTPSPTPTPGPEVLQVVRHIDIGARFPSMSVTLKPGVKYQVIISNTCPAPNPMDDGFAATDTEFTGVSQPPQEKLYGDSSERFWETLMEQYTCIATNDSRLSIEFVQKAGVTAHLIHVAPRGQVTADTQNRPALEVLVPVDDRFNLESFKSAFEAKCTENAKKKDDHTCNFESVLKDLGRTRPQKLPAFDFLIESPPPSAASRIELAGAFTSSWLTDPQYRLEPATDDKGGFFAYRNRSAEDSVRLGFAAMIHTRITEDFSISFGLGIEQTAKVSFFFGPSWRLWGDLFVTGGVNAGTVTRLPNGIVEGATRVTDQNALSSLPTRILAAPFISLSYSFLKPPESAFTQKFQSGGDKQTSSGGAGSKSP